MRFRPIRALGIAALALSAAGASYSLLFRRRCITWGARSEEVDREMPGDQLLADADMTTTRAISIDAPAAAIWPWLVQLGSGRGGAYTYDWIENLFGLDMHSADAILPQFQELEVGDTLPMGSAGPRMRVEVLEPDRFLVFRIEDQNWVWIFGLYAENGRTRLVSRNRIASPGASAGARVFRQLVMEPGSLVMERKMLLGIKQRAERLRA
jgi:hypothetical protein